MRFTPLHRIRSSRPVLIRFAHPTVAYITRLTATATFAYLLALLVPAGTNRPVLAPLTALLVLQASLYQTIRSVFRKVLSVTVGVLVAVAVSAFVDFSWWQLTMVIAATLLIGRVLRLGDDLLEVPISAMLIFSSAGTQVAATGRVVDTLVGAAAGLAGGLIFGRPRVQPARSAVGSLAGQLAGFMDGMAADLGRDRMNDDDLTGIAGHWLAQTRTLRDEIERVDDTLREAAESTRLNPRALVTPAGTAAATETTVALRSGLEALEHAALTLRGLARSVLDSAGIATEASPVRDVCTRARLAKLLAKLAAAIRTYGQIVQSAPAGDEALESELAAAFEEAHQLQDELADLLKPRPRDGGAPSEWPLRGEILNHVHRLRTGLSVEAVDALARVQRSAAQVKHNQRRSRVRSQARSAARFSSASRSSRRTADRRNTGPQERTATGPRRQVRTRRG